jgi:hypothetical protein
MARGIPTPPEVIEELISLARSNPRLTLHDLAEETQIPYWTVARLLSSDPQAPARRRGPKPKKETTR